MSTLARTLFNYKLYITFAMRADDIMYVGYYHKAIRITAGRLIAGNYYSERDD